MEEGTPFTLENIALIDMFDCVMPVTRMLETECLQQMNDQHCTKKNGRTILPHR
jgi:hypothetical protein